MRRLRVLDQMGLPTTGWAEWITTVPRDRGVAVIVVVEDQGRQVLAVWPIVGQRIEVQPAQGTGPPPGARRSS